MLSLDTITLGVPEVSAARDFYTAALSAAVKDDGDCVSLDLHGTGQVALSQTATLAEAAGASPAVSGFRGCLLSLVVDQPGEVRALVDTALRGGAEIRKPAKKMLFAGFSAVYQAPDGALWKVAAPTRKDAGPAGNPPLLTERIAILVVVDPQASNSSLLYSPGDVGRPGLRQQVRRLPPQPWQAQVGADATQGPGQGRRCRRSR